MADGVRALRNEGADISRRCNEAQTVLNVALVLAELIGKFSNAVPELGGHARKDCRLVERGEVLALKVLNHRNLDRLLIAHLFNDRGDHRERKRGDGTPASLAGNDLVVPTIERTDQNRLQDAVLTNACGQVVERIWVCGDSRLLWIR